jgi:hypothetical protein
MSNIVLEIKNVTRRFSSFAPIDKVARDAVWKLFHDLRSNYGPSRSQTIRECNQRNDSSAKAGI